MQYTVNNIQVVPIIPKDGLVGFASVVLDGGIYLGSIAIYTLTKGGYRISYPTRKVGEVNLQVFYPINSTIAKLLETAIIAKFQEVTKL